MNDAPVWVLVVDDDAFTAEMTGMVLEGAGYEVTVAEGGIDALDKLGANPGIGIVVSDLNMPLMNGLELFQELREAGHPQPFVLLTGGEASALSLAHPQLDGVVAKDEAFQENLVARVAALTVAQ
jgi:CheY-like chemotaxis protein